MSPSRAAVLSLALTLVAAAPAAASNGAIQPTYGTKGPVSIPIDGDSQTMFRMPSSIAWSLDDRIDLDLFYFYARETLSNARNAYSSSGGTPAGTVGAVLTVGRPDGDDDPAWDDYQDKGKFTFGTGFYVDMAGGGGSGARVFLSTYPESVKLKTGITFLNLTFLGAYTATDKLAFGASFHIVIPQIDTITLVGGSSTTLNGSPKVNDANFPGDPTYNDLLGLFANDASTDPSTKFKAKLIGVQFSGTLSVSFRPLDNLGFGLAWRLPSVGTPLTGDGKVDAERTVVEAVGNRGDFLRDALEATITLPGTPYYSGNYDVELRGLSVPQQVRFNVVFWPTPRVLVGFEVAWLEWQRSMRKARVKLNNGDGPYLNYLTGTTDLTNTITLRWHNQWVFAGQVAWSVNDVLTLRAGFNHGESPLNEREQGITATTGFTNTHVSVGGGVRFGNWEINALVEHAFYGSRHAGPDTDSLTAQNSRYGSYQWFFHVGVGYRF